MDREEIERRIENSLYNLGKYTEEEARNSISKILLEELSFLSLSELENEVERYYLRYCSKLGPIYKLIKDPDINEIMINGVREVFYEKHGHIYKAELFFDSIDQLEDVIRYIAAGVHREINELNPILDARLEDGSRVNAVYKNVAIDGPVISIRKFRNQFLSMEEMVSMGCLTRECLDFLIETVKKGSNIFVSGGTSTGKTTFLNGLAKYIGKDTRVVSIEDSCELDLCQVKNLVRLECRNANSAGKGEITMADLVKTSLRLRPDWIIVGEVRDGAIATMLQGLNTGHYGMSTGHGNSIIGMLHRMEAMYLMDTQMPVESIASQICQGIDIFIQLERTKEGKRQVKEVGKLLGYENNEYIVEKIFYRDGKNLIRSPKDIK